jgi:hypothetical protein
MAYAVDSVAENGPASIPLRLRRNISQNQALSERLISQSLPEIAASPAFPVEVTPTKPKKLPGCLDVID